MVTVSFNTTVRQMVEMSQGRNEEGQGGTISRAPKSPNNITSTLFNAIHWLPKDFGFEHGEPNLLLAGGVI